jgi:hypothetical protein
MSRYVMRLTGMVLGRAVGAARSLLLAEVLAHELRGRHPERRCEFGYGGRIRSPSSGLDQAHGVGGDAGQLGKLPLAQRRAPPHRPERRERDAPVLALLSGFLLSVLFHAVLLVVGVSLITRCQTAPKRRPLC